MRRSYRMGCIRRQTGDCSAMRAVLTRRIAVFSCGGWLFPSGAHSRISGGEQPSCAAKESQCDASAPILKSQAITIDQAMRVAGEIRHALEIKRYIFA